MRLCVGFRVHHASTVQHTHSHRAQASVQDQFLFTLGPSYSNDTNTKETCHVQYHHRFRSRHH